MQEIGLYECVDENSQTLYIGSSALSINKLEWNHRNYYRFHDGSETDFRKALRDKGSEWTFRWLQLPRKISRLQAEIEEGMAIRLKQPLYNKDQYPYETSVYRGRMEQI